MSTYPLKQVDFVIDNIHKKYTYPVAAKLDQKCITILDKSASFLVKLTVDDFTSD